MLENQKKAQEIVGNVGESLMPQINEEEKTKIEEMQRQATDNRKAAQEVLKRIKEPIQEQVQVKLKDIKDSQIANKENALIHAQVEAIRKCKLKPITFYMNFGFEQSLSSRCTLVTLDELLFNKVRTFEEVCEYTKDPEYPDHWDEKEKQKFQKYRDYINLPFKKKICTDYSDKENWNKQTYSLKSKLEKKGYFLTDREAASRSRLT